MKATARPVTRMKAAAYPWQGPVSPVALSPFTGLTYTLVDALGRTVTPSTTPTIRINGGQEHGLALSETTRTNAVPHDCPTRSQLSHVAGDSPADAAMASPVLRRTDWQGVVTLSPNPRTNYMLGSADPTVGWTKRGRTSVAATDAPTGSGLVAARLSGMAAIGDSYYRVSASTAEGARYPELWIRPVSTEGVVELSDPNGSSYGWWEIDLSKLTAGWQLVTASNPAVTVRRAWNRSTVPNSGIFFQRQTGGELSFDFAAPQVSDANGAFIPTTTAPVTVTDYTLGTFAPDGSLPVTLAQPASALEWANAPAGCSIERIDDTHYVLRQPAVSDGNLIGYAALTFSGDLTLGRSAWQDATIANGQSYSFSAIVEVEGEPTYGPDGLFRVVLSGDTPSIGTATWTAIPGQTNRYRLDVTGLSVASSTGRVGIYRAPGQADARPFTISRWTLCDHLGRLIAGNASEADFVRDGALVTLTRALTGGVVEAVWT